MSDGSGSKLLSLLYKYMSHMSSSEMEHGWRAQAKALWEGIVHDGKIDHLPGNLKEIHCQHAAQITTEIFGAHLTPCWHVCAKNGVVKRVLLYFRCREIQYIP